MLKILRKVKRWMNTNIYGSKKPWLQEANCEQIFTYIHDHNAWGDAESKSGVGSNLQQTLVLREQLPLLWSEFNAERILDIPCGDFFWMSHVDLRGRRYIGGDIVSPLVQANQSRYGRVDGSTSIRFEHLNLLESPLPQVDLVFCRDCLVHFSTADVRRALGQIKRSRATYLLTTTYPSRQNDKEIQTGEWRPLNLEAAPFDIPKPLKMLREGCTERGGRFPDKSLGLWRIADLPALS
jgi:SAM-dependent methyltransferase